MLIEHCAWGLRRQQLSERVEWWLSNYFGLAGFLAEREVNPKLNTPPFFTVSRPTKPHFIQGEVASLLTRVAESSFGACLRVDMQCCVSYTLFPTTAFRFALPLHVQ